MRLQVLDKSIFAYGNDCTAYVSFKLGGLYTTDYQYRPMEVKADAVIHVDMVEDGE